MAEFIIETASLECSRPLHSEEPSAVQDVTLQIQRGSLVHFHGPPGCGKNLLLHLLGLLEQPDSGEVTVMGQATSGWDDAARSAFRSRHFGFLFRAPHLLPSFSVVENIAIPFFKLGSTGPSEAGERTAEMLALAGLTDRGNLPAQQLDLAAQHRVALARALVARPDVLAIEGPLGTRESSGELLQLISAFAAQTGLTVLCAEGEQAFPGWRGIALESGRIAEDTAATILG